jgi:hypothetical protein
MRSFAACAFVAAVSVACVQPQAQNATPALTDGADTLRGIVRVVGSDPGTWITIQPEGARPVSLAGHDVDALRSVSEAEVWVRGRMIDHYFEVGTFAVRTADGRPTWDGVLRRSDGGLSLELTEGGVVSLSDPPLPLYEHVGSRIWITQPITGRGVNYGVIRSR